MAKKNAGGSWFDALSTAGMEVKSARDALQVKGFLDSGNYALNWALSGKMVGGGYPLGHCGEIFGDPSTGKSFLAARAIAMMQKAGGVALLDDAEGAYNAEHSSRIGVDVDALAYRKSHTVKNHLDATVAFIKAMHQMGGNGIIVLDSIAQLSTEHEMSALLDKRDMTKAAELKAFYRIVGNDLFDLPVIHMATNHTIANIGNLFDKRTTGGGGGPKFTASWRLDMRATRKIRKDKEVLGMICRTVVDKNRISTPFREVSLAIPFNQPISRASGLIPLLVALGVVEERGNFLYHEGQKLGRAYKTTEKFLQQDEQGEQILDTYPEILEIADAAIAQGRTASLNSSSNEEVDADEGEEEE